MARLAFLGSPSAAVPSLRALVRAGHDVSLVVSRPDKRRGRGQAASPSPVKAAALEAGIDVTDQLDDVLGSGAELAVVVAYGRIIPKRVLDVMPMVNAHFSLLPRWRGAAPVEHAILAGDRVTGVCIMVLEEGLDTGPVLAVHEVPIHDDRREHASELTERLASAASDLLVGVLRKGAQGLGTRAEQVGDPTYAPKLEPDDLRLDFTRPVFELERLVRLDRAWTTFRGKRLLVLDAIGLPDEAHGSGTKTPSELEPGTMSDAEVRCADGMLRLIEVQPAGRNALRVEDWTRGSRPAPGERLGG